MIYKKNKLIIDGIDAGLLARKFDTPIYCYSQKKIKENILNFKHHFKKIDPLITAKIWKTMINAFINYEYRNFNKK